MKRNDAFFPWETFLEAAQRGGVIGARLGLKSALVWSAAYIFVFVGTQLSIVTFNKQIDVGTFCDALYPIMVSVVGFVILGSVPVGVLGLGLGCVIGGVSVVPYISMHSWVRSMIGFGLVLMLLTIVFPLLRPILETDVWFYVPMLTTLLRLNVIFLAWGAIWLSVWLPIGMCDMSNKEIPVGERPVVYSALWLRLLRKFQGRTF